MDITLIQRISISGVSFDDCFNPCFSGYYTYTISEYEESAKLDFSFNPCFSGYYTYTYLITHILSTSICSFNPCFSGYYTYTLEWQWHSL